MKNQQGNVLVIILIAVILLAALSFAVTKGGQGGAGKSLLSEGDAKIATTQILKYAVSIENAVKRLQLVNGCSENEISFENSVATGYTNTTPSPTDKSCHIFDINGGGLTWQVPSNINDGSEWFYTDTNISDVGISGADLIMTLPNISRGLCLEINEQVNLLPTLGEPPQDNAVAYDNNKFTGTFPSNKVLRDDGNDTINGHVTGCFEGGSTPASGTYHFYHAIIVR